MKIIVGKDKYTGKPAAYATHAEAVQCEVDGEKKKLSDILDDVATSSDIAALFT